MTKQLSNIAAEATERQNTPGVMTPILEFQPEDGTAWEILQAVQRGDEMGIPITGGFEDSNGDPLPQDTEVVVQFEGPNDDQPYAVTEPKNNIRSYNSLSIQQQQNEEYIDAIKHVLKGRKLVVEDVDRVYVAIRSSAQIDWSQSGSRLTIDENAVREV